MFHVELLKSDDSNPFSDPSLGRFMGEKRILKLGSLISLDKIHAPVILASPDVPLVLIYFDLAQTVPRLLHALCSDELTVWEHLETQQALFKQFAEILNFIMQFDDLKVSIGLIWFSVKMYLKCLPYIGKFALTPSNFPSTGLWMFTQSPSPPPLHPCMVSFLPIMWRTAYCCWDCEQQASWPPSSTHPSGNAKVFISPTKHF